jgi:ammonia channel protein AmtB
VGVSGELSHVVFSAQATACFMEATLGLYHLESHPSRFFGVQVLGAIVVLAWSLTIMGSLFALLAYLKIFRVPEEIELFGLDEKKHEGAAYSNKSWSQLSSKTDILFPTTKTS